VKIKLTTVYVDDQEKALRFYTDVLGFVKKTDFSQGPYRWLTVASAEDPDGTELQLALNDTPAAKAYQEAMFQQGQPAAMFFTDDVAADYEGMKASGAEFTMPPTDVTASKIATVNDTCGNLIQVTQLMWYGGLSVAFQEHCRRSAANRPRSQISPASEIDDSVDRLSPAHRNLLRVRRGPGRVGASPRSKAAASTVAPATEHPTSCSTLVRSSQATPAEPPSVSASQMETRWVLPR
jgi:predicted enzyme related to lactoylglutathione lyase